MRLTSFDKQTIFRIHYALHSAECQNIYFSPNKCTPITENNNGERCFKVNDVFIIASKFKTPLAKNPTDRVTLVVAGLDRQNVGTIVENKIERLGLCIRLKENEDVYCDEEISKATTPANLFLYSIPKQTKTNKTYLHTVENVKLIHEALHTGTSSIIDLKPSHEKPTYQTSFDIKTFRNSSIRYCIVHGVKYETQPSDGLGFLPFLVHSSGTKITWIHNIHNPIDFGFIMDNKIVQYNTDMKQSEGFVKHGTEEDFEPEEEPEAEADIYSEVKQKAKKEGKRNRQKVQADEEEEDEEHEDEAEAEAKEAKRKRPIRTRKPRTTRVSVSKKKREVLKEKEPEDEKEDVEAPPRSNTPEPEKLIEQEEEKPVEDEAQSESKQPEDNKEETPSENQTTTSDSQEKTQATEEPPVPAKTEIRSRKNRTSLSPKRVVSKVETSAASEQKTTSASSKSHKSDDEEETTSAKAKSRNRVSLTEKKQEAKMINEEPKREAKATKEKAKLQSDEESEEEPPEEEGSCKKPAYGNRIFNHLKNSIAEMRKLDKGRIFWAPYKDKEYLKVIKNPMDLQTMEKKLENNEYDTVLSFVNDLDQIVENSKIFNGPNSKITEIALNLRAKFEKLYEPRVYCYCDVCKTTDITTTECNYCKHWYHNSCSALPEEGIETEYKCPACALTQKDFLEILKAVRKFDEEDGKLFLENPSRKEKWSAAYHRMIKYPTSFKQVENKLKSGEITTFFDFIEELDLIFENAMTFNPKTDEVYSYAEEFKEGKTKIVAEQYKKTDAFKETLTGKKVARRRHRY